MRNILKITLLASISIVLGGCVTNLDGQFLAKSAYQGQFYVERNAKDGRNLARNIATQLRARGLSATSGAAGQTPDRADYIVSYNDKWRWDMRMYLLNLRIDARDKNTNRMVGFGESRQSSLAAMGMTFDDVINRALDQMLR